MYVCVREIKKRQEGGEREEEEVTEREGGRERWMSSLPPGFYSSYIQMDNIDGVQSFGVDTRG